MCNLCALGILANKIIFVIIEVGRKKNVCFIVMAITHESQLFGFFFII